MCKLGIWQPGICRDSFKAGSSNEADRTPELRAFRVRLFRRARFQVLSTRGVKKASNCPAQTSRQGPWHSAFRGAIKGDLHESSELPWHSAFRIWQRIKGLRRLSRTWTMALCLSVAPSKAIFMSRLNSTSYLERPGLFGSGKGCTKGYASKYRVHSLVHLFAGVWRGYPEECCVFLDRAH